MGARQRAQKREQGMPKAGKGSLKGSPFSQNHGNSSLKVPSLDVEARRDALLGWQRSSTSATTGNRGMFSMSQEARNTERHVFGWGSTKLRGNAVAFVSAGHMTQDKPQGSPQRQETSSEGVGEEMTPESIDDVEESEAMEAVIHQHGPQNSHASIPVGAQIALEQVHISPNAPMSRHRSASASSSGSEQIVFTGRSNAPEIPSQTPSRAISTTRAIDPQIRPETVVPAPAPHTASVTEPVHVKVPLDSLFVSTEASSSDRRPVPGRRVRRGRRRPAYVSDEEEAIIQDYIANMAVDDDHDHDHDEDVSKHLTAKPVRKNETFRFHHGSGEENAKVQILGTGPGGFSKSSDAFDFDQVMDWNSEDLEIFDNASTSDEEVEHVEQVLRQRERPSGIQYLVTAKDRAVEDAKWLLQTRLVSASALEEIRIFEEIQAMGFEETFDEDDDENDEGTTSDEDEEALRDLIDNIESEDDENARIMAHTARMTDEQIARTLAKQEELGMDADELMLFGGDVHEGDDNVGREAGNELDAFARDDDFISFSTKQHTSNRTRSKRNQRQRDTFPSAAAFADALDEDPYGAFDVMDFDRPSLRPRKKGRKSGFPYDVELEDDELKEQLVSTWTKDREKKATRKREKEEARMAAVLDASERSEPAVIRTEIRRFLCQEMDVLRLAPMESSTRASVHRLAKALRINSRSEGVDVKGKGRYPVLTKTPRTPTYTIDTIWQVDALLNTRKFFPKNSNSYKTQRPPRTAGLKSRSTGGVQGASYMNGEVVGASAPELAADNKGRAMLEKMGWTSGMGIGAIGNKGSLEAIKHVVKTTKAGLG